jgi:di/tricarboxylate transporter
VTLRPGDTLLLQVQPHFSRAHRNDSAFYLVSDVEGWRPLRRDRAGLALGAFLVLILVMSSGIVPALVASTLCAVGRVAMGGVSTGDARRSIEGQVLVTIAAALGVGAALEASGAAPAIATAFVDLARPWGPLAALAAIYALGSVLTALVTNTAAAVLMFPFCLETARLYDADPRPFLIALILSASASFSTPIGYQTNMMVYGPGGYRFGDFFRIGAPLNLLLAVVALLLIPLIWPF